jgi:hypothetical protein
MAIDTYLHQCGEHRLDRRHHPCVRGIGLLQGDQVRQFGIDVDTRLAVEALLQRVDDHVLALLKIAGRGRVLALLAGDLAHEIRERPAERGGPGSHAGRWRERQGGLGQLI